MFPNLKGGENSLVFFYEIAAMRESDFVRRFTKQTLDDHVRDLLEQSWRNAQIARQKFTWTYRAMCWMAAAASIWVIFLVAAAAVGVPINLK